MHNRSEFLKRLRADDRYKQALAKARNDNERRAIAATVEGFVSSFADVLGPLIERAESDPEFARQLGRELSERKSVVTTSEPATTGSTG